MNKYAAHIAKNALTRYSGGTPFHYGVILNKTLIISECYNSFLTSTFPSVETLFLDKCEKNFIYYNVNTHYFPNVKTIYCNSHPCEPQVLQRHHYMYSKQSDNDENEISIYLTKMWIEFYKKRWFSSADYIQSITTEKMYDIMNTYEVEELIYEKEPVYTRE
jgi:hypothetical protein